MRVVCMVNDDVIKKYSSKEASELKVYCVALDVENNILKAQLDSVRNERNKLLRKLADIDLSKDSPPQQNQGNYPNIPKVNRPV